MHLAVLYTQCMSVWYGYLIFQLLTEVHWSVTTLKPLTGEVNSIYYVRGVHGMQWSGKLPCA